MGCGRREPDCRGRNINGQVIIAPPSRRSRHGSARGSAHQGGPLPFDRDTLRRDGDRRHHPMYRNRPLKRFVTVRHRPRPTHLPVKMSTLAALPDDIDRLGRRRPRSCPGVDLAQATTVRAGSIHRGCPVAGRCRAAGTRGSAAVGGRQPGLRGREREWAGPVPVPGGYRIRRYHRNARTGTAPETSRGS